MFLNSSEEVAGKQQQKIYQQVSKVWMFATGIVTWAYFANSANRARKTERMNTARDGGVSP